MISDKKAGIMLQLLIEQEVEGKLYSCTEQDKTLLAEMISEINLALNKEYSTLSELTSFPSGEVGDIVIDYIMQFQSISLIAYLLDSVAMCKNKNRARIILDLYYRFKNSREYISPEGVTSPAYIFVRFDNAIKRLKPKKFADELVKLISNPRDAMYLPLTTNMVASWKIPEVKDLLIGYLIGENITADRLQITDSDKYYPSLKNIKRELAFAAFSGLKYYPSCDVYEVVSGFVNDSDKDIKASAEELLSRLNKENTTT